MERYKITGHLSAGAHGVVFKAIDRKSSTRDLSEMLAIKRMFIKGRHKMPLSVVREIKSLQLLDGHPYIVSLKDVFVLGSSVNLVFPLLPTNLTALIYFYQMNTFHQKVYSYMLCEGVRYMHQMQLIHRDLKPANLLIDWKGYLKICDFGQTRIIADRMSHQVSTRWYRSPELLYGSETYKQDSDMWSVGCILAEIYLSEPIFSADSDIAQLFLVISSLGLPPHHWAETLPDYNKISFTTDSDELKEKHERWMQMLQNKICDQLAYDVVVKQLKYIDRLSADETVNHKLFYDVKDRIEMQSHLLFRPVEVKHLVGPPRRTGDTDDANTMKLSDQSIPGFEDMHIFEK